MMVMLLLVLRAIEVWALERVATPVLAPMVSVGPVSSVVFVAEFMRR